MKDETAKQEKKRDPWVLKEKIANIIAYTVLALGTLLTAFFAAVTIDGWFYSEDENYYIEGDIYIDDTEVYWLSATITLIVAAITWFTFTLIRRKL